MTQMDMPRIPSQKEIRYDRQLRLWGDHGQQDLETCKVCLLNATATGTEILKSLVLPGAGSITIVDDALICEENGGNNFFLHMDRVGEPRGKVACELLHEMNPDVEINFLQESVEMLLKNNVKKLAQYSVVIATELCERSALELAHYLWDLKTPLVICRSYGFFGYLRLIVPEHYVIETHDDNAYPDFRLDCPFPELVQLVNEVDFATMTHEQHSHTPYVVLLLKCLREWDVSQNGYPNSHAKRQEFRKFLLSKRMPDEKGSLEEENFKEAVDAMAKALVATSLPVEVKAIFDDPQCIHLSADSSPFWIQAHALSLFVNNEGGGLLPVRGSLPDMISDSDRYVRLLNVYREKALADSQCVMVYAQKLLESLKLPPSFISFDDVKFMCKHAAFMCVQKGRSLAEEYTAVSAAVSVLKSRLEQGSKLMVLYILLRAAERFYTEMNRFPGTNGIPDHLDKADYMQRVTRLMTELDLPPLTEEQLPYVEEVCRCGATELHSTAAFMGGVAAQEIIKLITHQYVPVNNTFVYDGLSGNGEVFRL